MRCGSAESCGPPHQNRRRADGLRSAQETEWSCVGCGPARLLQTEPWVVGWVEVAIWDCKVVTEVIPDPWKEKKREKAGWKGGVMSIGCPHRSGKPPSDTVAGWSSLVAREAHNLEVVGSNPAPATCFDGSETRLPSGYTKGRHPRVTAFSRSIASSGNDFERRRWSRFGDLDPSRATPWPALRSSADPISAETLDCLSVSRRLG